MVWPFRANDTVWYFPVVLFVMLWKLVLTLIPTFESVDEILWCDHSKESYWAVLSCATVYDDVTRGLVPIESVDKILQCDHSVTFPAVLFHGTNCFVLVFSIWCLICDALGRKMGLTVSFFFSLWTTKPAPTSFSYNVLLCVITKNIGSNTVELITDFFPCCSDNDLHRSSLEMIGNALNFLVNSWEIISVWISSPGQSGWWLALDDAS